MVSSSPSWYHQVSIRFSPCTLGFYSLALVFLSGLPVWQQVRPLPTRTLPILVSNLFSGFAIGIVGDAGVRGTAQQPRLFVGMILILIFAEVLGLYGLIVALLMNSKASTDVKC